MNAGMLLRRILETCATVREALAFLKSAPIGSAQTLTLADARGEIAVVECDALGMAVVRPPTGATLGLRHKRLSRSSRYAAARWRRLVRPTAL